MQGGNFRTATCCPTLTLVGALLQLLVVGSLLHKLQNGHTQLGVGQGVRLGVNFGGLSSLRKWGGTVRDEGCFQPCLELLPRTIVTKEVLGTRVHHRGTTDHLRAEG